MTEKRDVPGRKNGGRQDMTQQIDSTDGTPDKPGSPGPLPQQPASDHWTLGVFCVAVGGVFVWIGRNYAFGSVADMGPGFFPTVVAILLMLNGVIIILWRGRDVGHGLLAEAVDAGATSSVGSILRILVCILGSLLAFALTAEKLGALLASVLVVAIASCAQRGTRPVETAITVVAIAGISTVFFVLVLKIPLPVVPR